MRLRLIAALLLVSSACFAQAPQKPIVTFYTPGGVWKGNAKLIGKGDSYSTGFIHEGDKRLAKLAPGKFMSLEVEAGLHHFSVSEGHKINETVDIDAQPGEHYFLQVTTTKAGAMGFASFTGHMVRVDCKTASREADGTRPTDIRMVFDKPTRQRLVGGPYFPHCE